jgi:O-antigen/teichoic acid export membrane protein
VTRSEIHEQDSVTAPSDVLASQGAGDRAIRGSAMRVGGYLAGAGLVALASVFLLRYLGPVDFGRYVTVTSLVAIVSGVTDAGLTLIGSREYVLQRTEGGQRTLLADLVGIRLVFTPLGVLLAAAFAAVAGYGSTLVIGTLLAGAGLVIANTAATMTVPLVATLRLGAVSAVELARNVVTVAGIGLLVAAGADLLPFFGVQIAAGAAAFIVTVALARRAAWVAPRFVGREWRSLLREAAPVAAGQVVNVVYLRILVILVSLLAAGVETGLFATSYRIVEILLGVPMLMVGAAFPILAHAGATEEARFAYAMQRLGEASLLAAGAIVFVLAVAAEPIVRLLGGSAYEGAAAVLRIQSFALLGAFMTQVWTYGLVALRRQEALVVMNLIGLAVVLGLGLTLIPVWGARGAALSAAVGEGVLATSALVLLVRARPAMRPSLGYVRRLAVAAGLGAATLLIPGIPAAAGAVVGLAVYLGAAWRLGAVPTELVRAFARPDPGGDAPGP